MNNKYNYKVGVNRGNARIWIEGTALSANGWNAGDLYIVRNPSLGIITARKDPEGARKVARHGSKPVLEISNTKTFSQLGEGVKRVNVIIHPKKITITAAE